MSYKRLFEYVKKVISYKGRNIFDTEHSVQRFKERFPSLKITDWEKVLKDGIDTILDIFRDSTGKYIIVSKSTNIAIQLEWRKDRKSRDDKNHGFTATTLDYTTQKREIQGDRKLFVENIKDTKLEKQFPATLGKSNSIENNWNIIKIKECDGYMIWINDNIIDKSFKVVEV